MPTPPNRSRKALEELARVCNKLASELTADLRQAASEIENLKREIQRIRRVSTSHKNTTTSRNTIKKPKTTRRVSKAQGKNSGKATYLPESAREKGPAHEAGAYVFPKEPFNPPTPPAEPSTHPENN